MKLAIFFLLGISLGRMTMALAGSPPVETLLQSAQKQSGGELKWTYDLKEGQSLQHLTVTDDDGVLSVALLTQMLLREGKDRLAAGEPPTKVYPTPVAHWEVLGPILFEQLYRSYQSSLHHLGHGTSSAAELRRLSPLMEKLWPLRGRTPTFGELKQIENEFLAAWARYHSYSIEKKTGSGDKGERLAEQKLLDPENPFNPLRGIISVNPDVLFSHYLVQPVPESLPHAGGRFSGGPEIARPSVGHQ